MLTINDKIILKKSYMGEKNLTEVMMDPDVSIIEDWAFANCKALTKVWIPGSIERICDNAFFNCDKLVSIELYDDIDKTPLYEGKYAYVLALMVGQWTKDTQLFTDAVKDDSLFVKLSKRLPSFLEETDDSGFEPFLAGGEEDYDVKGAEERYCHKRRLLKAKLIYEYLLSGKDKIEGSELSKTCIRWLKDHNPSAAFGAILDAAYHRKEYLKIYLDNAIDEGADLNELIGMADADTEIKVTLLSSKSEKAEKQDSFFDSLLV